MFVYNFPLCLFGSHYIYIIIALCCGFVFIHGSYICIFVYILLVNILEQKPNWIDQIPQDWCLNPRSVAGYYIILLVASCHTSYSHYIASSIPPHHGWFLYPHICWFSPHIFAGSNYSTPPQRYMPNLFLYRNKLDTWKSWRTHHWTNILERVF